jgi:hypothetical protein
VLEEKAIGVHFGAALIMGLADLGPFPAPGDDLSLELGLSVWLCVSDAEIEEAIEAVYEVRSMVLEEAEMDVDTEPVPFVGRSSDRDLITLGSYMDNLLERASVSSGCHRQALARRVAAKFVPVSVVESLAC